jgi:hypothetical protein
MTDQPVNPVTASRQARHAYWREHFEDGNRVDAERAADEAYNRAVINGPKAWRQAYPLRALGRESSGS